MSTIKDLNGQEINATSDQIAAIQSLIALNKGGIGTIHGYRPSTNYIERPVQNINFIARFSTTKLYERKIAALAEIRFSDVEETVKADAKLNALSRTSQIALFELRKGQLVDESMNKTLTGDRSDGHRQGHDRCYASFGDGIKVNLVTEKREDGLKHPVLTNGLPTVASIMVHYLELQKTVVTEGKRKTVNSGPAVLMSNAIQKQLNLKSVGLKTFSLKADNFDSLNIQRKTFLPEDVADNSQVYDLLFG